MGHRKASQQRTGSDSTSSENGGHRHGRLQELLTEELQSLLRDDVTDPLLDGIAVRAVVLSVDYRNARVHYTRTSTETNSAPMTPAVLDRAFLRATPFLRARLAEALDLKRVPELRFVLDADVSFGE